MSFGRHKLVIIAAYAQLWLLGSPVLADEDEATQTREEWQAQVERARQRVEQIRREGTFVDQEAESEQENAKETSRRALDDEALRAGDIVSTENGFVRFDGLAPDDKRVFSPVAPRLDHGK
jgi:hypothetical protein